MTNERPNDRMTETDRDLLDDAYERLDIITSNLYGQRNKSLEYIREKIKTLMDEIEVMIDSNL